MKIDITGKRYGKWTVLKKDSLRKSSSRETMWICKCDCGTISSVSSASLRSGRSKSCGCVNRKHGMWKNRLYFIWQGIKDRCLNKKTPAYGSYGGRGITICDEWKNDFLCFMNWSIANGYSKTLTIDRIDNNKGYSPNNCRWASKKEQSLNRRSNRLITINNVTKPLSVWCEEYNMPYNTVENRIVTLKWDSVKAITTPIRKVGVAS